MSTNTVKKPARTRQPREQRIRVILDCAEEVFNERGYEKATVAEIARRVGVVEGTVFSYFNSKQELVLQIITRWYAALFQELIDGLKGIVGTRNRLRYIIWSQLNAVNQRAELTGVVILTARGMDRQFSREVNELYGEYTRPLIETLAEGMKSGEVKKDISPQLVSHMLYGGIEQLFWKMIDDGGRLDVEKVADEMVELVFGGILAPADPASDIRGDRLLDRLEALLDQRAD